MIPAIKDYKAAKHTPKNLDVIAEDEEEPPEPIKVPSPKADNSDLKPVVAVETYPLKSMKTYPEVLLVSSSSLKAVLETKIGFRCEDVQMEEAGIASVKKALQVKQQKNTPFFSYIMVDLDDVTIIIERFGRTLKRLFIEAGIKPEEINLYAFSTTESEKIKQHCARGNFRFYVKPAK